MDVITQNKQQRRIKSFVRRSGRVTARQEKALAELGQQYILADTVRELDWQQLFANANPVVLEIGFGMGDATAEIARAQPQINYVACEVHKPGVGALLAKIEDYGLKNVRIAFQDATEVIAAAVADGSLAGIHIFFPDPWPKKRHHKRRLIQTQFIAKLVPKLQLGGYIHCATDWQPYAEQILSVLTANGQLVNQSMQPDGYSAKPHYRPLTKFERRGLRLGHGVWDIVFKRSQ